MNLRDKYGYCVIPADTILFTSEPEYSDGTNRFFALKHWVANAWNNENRKFTVYKMKKDIEILFMIKEMKDNEVYISCGDDILIKFYPDNKAQVDDLSIKQNYHLRQKMMDILSSQNLAGWLTTLEGRKELEVFLFGNQQQLNEYVKPINYHHSDYQYYDALNCINVFPSSEFYLKSESNFSKNFSEYEEWNKGYEESYIKEDSYTKEQAQFESFNLRLKLKI